jgi:hypothetical protein
MPTRLKNITVLCLFTAAYAVLFGLGVECLFHLIGIMLGSAIDGGVVFDYPRLVPFCLIVGFLSLITLIGLFLFNIHVSEKCGYTKIKWWLQSVAVLLLWVPMAWLWELLFDFLRAAF